MLCPETNSFLLWFTLKCLSKLEAQIDQAVIAEFKRVEGLTIENWGCN